MFIAAPLRWVGLLPAFLEPGDPGTQVPQTLRFSRFIVCPPGPLEFKAFWDHYRALAVFFLPPTVVIDWIGPWPSRFQKSALS